MKRGGSGATYRCTTSAGGCGALGIRAYPLERYVLVESLRHYVEGRSGDESAQEVPSEPDPEAAAELRQVEKDIAKTYELAGAGEMRPTSAAEILKRLEERQKHLADRVGRSLRTAPKPPVSRLSQMFTPAELRSVGIERPTGRYSAEEFHMRWADREPEAVAAVRDLVLSQVERITVRRRQQRGRGFDPTRVRIVWRG